MPVFTVFTATHNRAHLLHRVYNSLLHQTFKNFEWIIVDDGSTDNTKEVVDKYISSSNTFFSIKYFYQTNKHKKTAFNKGVIESSGEFFLNADSDDSFLPKALSDLYQHWNAIENKNEFSAVTGLCQNSNGEIIGEYFPCKEYIDSDSSEMFYKYKVRGEKWGFQKVEVLKEFTYPDNVRGYVPEGYVWMLIANKYKTRYINVILRTYHNDINEISISLSKNGIRSEAPGRLIVAKMKLDTQFKYFLFDPISFLLDAARITRLKLLLNKDDKVKWLPQKWTSILLVLINIPLGLIWFLFDLFKEAKNKIK
jgi:glycosyltransferase involved in cell wall biosynthesis